MDLNLRMNSAASHLGQTGIMRAHFVIASSMGQVSSRALKHRPAGRSFTFPPIVCNDAGMKSHELLNAVFDKCSPKEVASELGLSVSMVYKWAEPAEGGSG